eukprot:7986914-Pyramimonas_sp.AAC.1
MIFDRLPRGRIGNILAGSTSSVKGRSRQVNSHGRLRGPQLPLAARGGRVGHPARHGPAALRH